MDLLLGGRLSAPAATARQAWPLFATARHALCMVKMLIALLLCSGAALAQPAAPCPACNEDPTDVAARVLYERAVRAEYDGRRDDARREAQDCIAQKPGGRFAVAAQSLIERVQTRPGPTLRRDSGVGPRTELVIESTLVGAYLSGLLVGATDAGGKAGTAMVMAGTG